MIDTVQTNPMITYEYRYGTHPMMTVDEGPAAAALMVSGPRVRIITVQYRTSNPGFA